MLINCQLRLIEEEDKDYFKWIERRLVKKLLSAKNKL